MSNLKKIKVVKLVANEPHKTGILKMKKKTNWAENLS